MPQIVILLIEDDRILRKSLYEILRLEDFLVVEAENGTEGVQSAQDTQPDLVICDLEIPYSDGYAVIENLKLNPLTKEIPVILMSAAIHRLDDSRVEHVIGKPFQVFELLKIIKSILGL